MKTISIIVAMAKNRVIGKRGAIPWYLPADLARFKRLTMRHPIIMGRKTHESIGRALPGRQNIVITRQEGYQAKGCDVVHSLEEALERAEGDEVFVIGGAEIYREALPLAKRIYLTGVDAELPGDVYFPEFDRRAWREVERVPGVMDEKNPYPHTFFTLERSK